MHPTGSHLRLALFLIIGGYLWSPCALGQTYTTTTITTTTTTTSSTTKHAATTRTTTTTTTTLPRALSCQDGVTRLIDTLARELAHCHLTAVHRAFRRKRFNLEGCELRAKGRFRRNADRRSRKPSCPACLAGSQSGVEDLIESSLDGVAAAVYCGTGPQLDADEALVLPGSRDVLKCDDRSMRNLSKFVSALIDCRIAAADARFQMKTPDEPGCTGSATASYDQAQRRLGGCPGCFDPTHPRDQLKGQVVALSAAVYCPCLIGSPGVCDDQNPCTTDSCDPRSGCQNVVVANGTACPPDACTIATCSAGQCIAGGKKDCDDNNPCTKDSCDAVMGCIHDPAPLNGKSLPGCTDNNACTFPDSCQSGVCRAGPPVDCTNGNPCMYATCNPLTGCSPMGMVGDGTPCTTPAQTTGTCHGGVCS